MNTHREVAYNLIRPVTQMPFEVTEHGSLEGHIVFENDQYVPEQNQAYVECLWRPGIVEATLDQTTHMERGTMRFMAMLPLKGGAAYTNTLADDIMSTFPVGNRFTQNGWAVTILSLARSQATRAGAWRRVFVDVTYQANTV